jgi:hypothetical protein
MAKGNGRGIAVIDSIAYYTVAEGNTVFKANMTNCADLGTAFVAYDLPHLSSIAYDGANFWIANYMDLDKAQLYTPNGALLMTSTLDGYSSDGLEFFNGKLISNRGDAVQPYDIYAITGGAPLIPNFITTTTSPGFRDATGIAYDGTSFIVSDIFNQKLQIFDGTTGAFLKTIKITGLNPGADQIEDLSADYAQTLQHVAAASDHFPNDAIGGGNVDNPCINCGPTAMTCTVFCEPPKKTVQATVALTAGESGATVAADEATALCTNDVSCGPCIFPGTVSCSGYSITVLPGSNGVSISSLLDTRISAFHCITFAGNTTEVDLLDRVLIRVDPNAHNGNLIFMVTGAPGPGPNPFTVDSTGLSDLALHTAISNGFSSLGLSTRVRSDSGISAVPSDFNGYFVEIAYPASVTDFEVNGQPGQILTTETSLGFSSVSALSDWGLGILVSLLLLGGVVVMLRRARVQSA